MFEVAQGIWIEALKKDWRIFMMQLSRLKNLDYRNGNV